MISGETIEIREAGVAGGSIHRHDSSDEEDNDDHDQDDHDKEHRGVDDHGLGLADNGVRVRTLARKSRRLSVRLLNEEDEGGGNYHHNEEDGHGHSDSEDDEPNFEAPDLDHDDEHSHGTSPVALESRAYLVATDETSATSEVGIHLYLDLKVNQPGTFLPLIAVQLFLSNTTVHGHEPVPGMEVAYKMDIANLMDQRSVTYHEEIQERNVSKGLAAFSYISIAVAGFIQAVLLGLTIRCRNQPIMKLSQWSFLVALQVSAFIAALCAFLFQPKSDIFCILSRPLVLIPLQFMAAVVYGRMMRILSIMGPLMSWTTPRTKKDLRRRLKVWTENMRHSPPSSTSTSNEGSKTSTSSNNGEGDGQTRLPPDNPSTRMRARIPRSLRIQFSGRKLWIVIVLFTLPQVIIQVIGQAVFDYSREFVMNEAESEGRYECGVGNAQWYDYVGISCLFISLFVTLVFAQRSRSLPAVFNEAVQVSNALLASLFVGCLGLAVVIASDSAEVDAGIPYILVVIVIVNTTLNVTVRIMLPKLILIWKGEKVAVNTIIKEHREAEAASLAASSTLDAVTGERRRRSSLVKAAADAMFATATDPKLEKDSTAGPVMIPSAPSESTRRHLDGGGSSTINASHVSFNLCPDSRVSNAFMQQSQEQPRIRMQSGAAPPREVVLEIVEHSQNVSRVNERILTGLQVQPSDWDTLKRSLEDLQAMLGRMEYSSISTMDDADDFSYTV